MTHLIRKVIKHCSTGADNETYNPVRVVGYISVSAAVIITCAAAVHMLLTKDVFDYAGFGQSIVLLMGSLLAVGSAEAVQNIGTKEPKKKEEENV